ncbi:MAG: helix-turn-helix transcriptional regulator [Candidatus Omnitrophota bacterium]|nr:MAG: helix-turn-helix transcriptional regulator [Candidatus Omnitrophota bacterium]
MNSDVKIGVKMTVLNRDAVLSLSLPLRHSFSYVIPAQGGIESDFTKKPSIQTIQKVAKALGVSLDKLVE